MVFTRLLVFLIFKVSKASIFYLSPGVTNSSVPILKRTETPVESDSALALIGLPVLGAPAVFPILYFLQDTCHLHP